ncbi:MAG: universal stress protein [Acidobacteriota bacterium]|nr:MAG: universal stress protein [Acidobacteriota bacterium]
MNSQIDTVVLPLDRSALSERAIPIAREYASRSKSSVVLLSVPHADSGYESVFSDTQIGIAGAEIQQALERLDEKAQERTRGYLQYRAESLADSGLRAETRTCLGAPAAVIAGVAEEYPGSMIIMATHGRGGVRRWMLGSVAEKVLHFTKRPIMLVPAAAEPVPQTVGRIMVALDGSRLAERSLATATRWARTFAAALLMVHVAPDFGEMARASSMPLLEFEERYLEWLRSYFTGVQERLGLDDLDVTSEVLPGGWVVDSLLARSASAAVDVIIMSSHGHGGHAPWALGSVAARVARSAIVPVLIVPTRETD